MESMMYSSSIPDYAAPGSPCRVRCRVGATRERNGLSAGFVLENLSHNGTAVVRVAVELGGCIVPRLLSPDALYPPLYPELSEGGAT